MKKESITPGSKRIGCRCSTEEICVLNLLKASVDNIYEAINIKNGIRDLRVLNTINEALIRLKATVAEIKSYDELPLQKPTP